MSSSKKQKLLKAIKEGRVIDDITAVSWIFEQKKRDELIKDIASKAKGDKGDIGEKGIKGETGQQGLVGIKGETGNKGKDGQDGKLGIDGIDGKTPVIGVDYSYPKDGSPDTGEQIVNKINELPEEHRIDKEHIKGLEEYITRRIVGGGSIARNFYQLFDVPQNYAGQTGKVLSVKSDETGLEFSTAATATTIVSENLSSQCDGSNKVFTTTNDISFILIIHYNGGVLTEGVEANKTDDKEITLGFAPASGDDLRIKYI